MTKGMLKIYTRNQISLYPEYNGEELTIEGKVWNNFSEVSDINLTKMKYAKYLTNVELLMAYFSTVSLMTLGGADNTAIFGSYRLSSQPMEVSDNMFRAIADTLYNSAKTNFVKSKDKEIFRNKVMMPKLTSVDVELALQYLLKLKGTAFIDVRCSSNLNGNLVDLFADTFNRFSTSIGEISSIANFLVSFGLPYSDYKLYIADGLLVSYGRDKTVSVVKDDVLYTVDVQEFIQDFLVSKLTTEMLNRKYSQIYSYKDTDSRTYLELNKGGHVCH